MIILLFSCQQPSLFSEAEQKIILRMKLPETTISDQSNRHSTNTEIQEFGEMIFFDTRLSHNETVSCSTCHDPDLGWTDGNPYSEGLAQTPRHAPTLWNVSAQRWFNWDGSCDSLWCQATGPIEKPGEMGLSRVSLVHMLSQNPDLKTSYESLFGPLPDSETWPSSASPASFAVPEDLEAWQSLSELEQSAATEVLVNIAKSIAAFESKIIPPPTKLDTFVDVFATDEDQALDLLTSQQERGLRLFLGEGQCHLCHSGAYLSDKQFHNIGLPITETTPLDDLGRYTGLEILSNNPFNQAGLWSDDPNGDRANQISRLLLSSEDLGRFKTPSLRQLSQTAPYMHTGQFETLYEVVEHYTDVEEDPIHGHAEEFLLPLDWDEDDIEAMVQFLQIVSNNIE